MLLPRITPVLLLSGSNLVKTVNFSGRIYIGDPLNVVKIFNELSVDELVIYDIDASVANADPDYNLLTKIATVSRMPLCYGGGVSSISHIERIVSLGIEKVSISSSSLSSPQLISDASSIFGSQSIVVTLDIKRPTPFSPEYFAYTHNGTRKSSLDLKKFCSSLRRLGAGELIINSVSHDGTFKGYDHNLLKTICPLVDLPMTILGGASSFEDFSNLFRNYSFVSAAAASLFIFHGKYKAVLISYPDSIEKANIFNVAGLI